MEDNYILILGAGLMQRPSIEAAKELGYKTLVVDANPEAVCASFADRFERIDLKDKESIARLALSLGNKISAVFTAGTDFSASVSYVAEKCSLPSHSYESALNASNKFRMRECFKKGGVPSPNFQTVSRSSISSFLERGVLDKIDFPKVVKPVDNMGARGCRLVRSQKEFLPAVEEAVRYSRSGTAILEDYMDGAEYSIDALVCNGTLTITGFADRHIFYQPYFIEMGHTMPSLVDDKKRNELILCFARGVKALGLTCGAAKADIKYTKDGPMIGEIAARLSGGYMSGWTYPYAADFNLTKQALLIALGKAPSELYQRRHPLPVKGAPFGIYEISPEKTSAERAWISVPGRISKVYGLETSAAVPFIRNVLPRNNAGDEVDFPRNNVQKCGNCISLSSDYEFAVRSAERAVASIVLRLEVDNKKTDAFLSSKFRADEKDFPPSFYELDSEAERIVSSLKEKISTVPENTPLLSLLTETEKIHLASVRDCNHRSIYLALSQFDSICPEHPCLDGKKFWKYFIRGGLQGILYYSDSVSGSFTGVLKRRKALKKRSPASRN